MSTDRPDGAPAPGARPSHQHPESAAGPRTEETGGRWRRVHPLTPLVRFWLFFVLLAFNFLRQGVEEWFQDHDGASWLTGIPDAVAHASPWTWISAGGVVLVCLGLMTFSWWFHRFRIVEDTVQFRQGALFRTEKQARLDRVQSIEITQSLLPRLLGMAELRFDVADSGDAVLSLRYLGRKKAERLREDLLLRRNLLQDAERASAASQHPVQPSAVVLSVPTGRVLGAVLLETWWLVVAAPMVVPSVVLSLLGQPAASASFAVPLAFALVGGLWSRLNEWGGYRLFSEGSALRIRHGLASTAQRTIPRGRIQAVGVSQPFLWRFPGWFRVTLTVAGAQSSGSSEKRTRRVFLPVATGQELMDALPLVLESPRPGDLDGAQMKAALEGTGTDQGFTVSPRRARWLAPFTWRRTGFVDAGQYLFLRRGRFTRRLTAIPHDRTQSLALKDGPLRRVLGLADLSFHTVAGPVPLVLPHLDLQDARRLAAEQAARAAVARRSVPDAPEEPSGPAGAPESEPEPSGMRPSGAFGENGPHD